VRRSGGEASVEGLQVGVDITKQQYVHGSPDELRIIDRGEAAAKAALRRCALRHA
jgi:hypothetical protein